MRVHEPMRVLILCEESQTLTKAFRAAGHEAFSCDIQECSGGHPEWHLRMDAFIALIFGKWDLVIMHPPCTCVAVSGNGTYADTPERANAAKWNATLFAKATDVCEYVAMENPVGVMNSLIPELPKPHYVDIWWFGTKEMKKTGWWLYGLPALEKTANACPPPADKKERIKWMKTWTMSPGPDRGKLRSKLDPNMADAIVDQWTKWIYTDRKLSFVAVRPALNPVS